jgi:hypothetical protein
MSLVDYAAAARDRWLTAFQPPAPPRPCGCFADVIVFGHVTCPLAPPRRTGEFRGGYCEPVR